MAKLFDTKWQKYLFYLIMFSLFCGMGLGAFLSNIIISANYGNSNLAITIIGAVLTPISFILVIIFLCSFLIELQRKP